jgi:hypothetical protein
MAKHIFKMSGPPTFAPRQVGHHYVDLANGDQYLSSGTLTSADWVKQIGIDKLVRVAATDTTSGYLKDKLVAGTAITITEQTIGGNETLLIAASGSAFTDEKVKVSATDTTPDYLNAKAVAGTGLTKTILNPAGNEQAEFKIANTTVIAASYGSATQVPSYTVDAQGRLTAASNVAIAIPSTQITDFAEATDDRVAALVVAGTGVTVTYNDPLNTLTIAASGAALLDEKVKVSATDTTPDYLNAKVAAGTGLTKTTLNPAANEQTQLSITNTTVIAASYGSATAIPTFTVNAQGQLTAAATSAALTPGAIGAQPADGDLTGISNLTGTGVVIRTAADTYTTRTVTAGTGISVTNGDGVSGNPTVGLSNVGTAGTYGSASQVPVITTNAQGQVSSVTNTAIAIASTAVSDFTEAAQDSVGGILTDTASIDFTYNDAGNQITAAVLPAGVDHNALLNWVANKHIDHSTVSITAGTGLSGGGDLTATRTISMPNVGTAGTYGNATNYPIITTDAQGRVTAVTTTPAESRWVVDTTLDPGGLLTWTDGTGQDLCIRQGGSSGSAYIRQVSSNGTLAAPTASTSGQRLGGNGMYGWNTAGLTGVDPLPAVAWNGYATENHTAGAQGGELRVEIIANGTTTPVTTAIFANNGDLGLIGSLNLGTGTQTIDGTIRYSGSELQGRQGGVWAVLSQVPTSVNATGAVTTTSVTFATVGSMTSTPAAGTYKLDFTCSVGLSAATSTGDFGVFIGAAEQAQCRRTFGNGASTATQGVIAISTLVTVNGAQAVTIQFRENASATLTVNAREMILTPISR